MQFIERNKCISITIALFGTSVGEGKEVEALYELLQSKNATVKGSFYSKVKFLFFNRGIPNDKDPKATQSFAKKF